SARLLAVCERWNRKLHFYSGLFLIVFLWLFAFTGLLLNHPTWTFHESWRNRHETKFQLPIVRPAAGLTSDLEQARDLMRQMSIDGEILWTTTRSDGAPSLRVVVQRISPSMDIWRIRSRACSRSLVSPAAGRTMGSWNFVSWRFRQDSWKVQVGWFKSRPVK